MKSQTPHLSDYKLLIDLLEDLWQAPQLILPKNLLKEFIKLNVNMNKMIKTYGITYRDFNCFLEYTNFKKDLIEKKCFFCNKDYQKKFDENLKKRSFNAYTFSNHDINKLILSLEKGVYPCELIGDWGKLN